MMLLQFLERTKTQMNDESLIKMIRNTEDPQKTLKILIDYLLSLGLKPLSYGQQTDDQTPAPAEED